MNAVPVVGVLALDWSLPTLLLIYWIELGVNLVVAVVEGVVAEYPPAGRSRCFAYHHREGGHNYLRLRLWRTTMLGDDIDSDRIVRAGDKVSRLQPGDLLIGTTLAEDNLESAPSWGRNSGSAVLRNTVNDQPPWIRLIDSEPSISYLIKITQDQGRYLTARPKEVLSRHEDAKTIPEELVTTREEGIEWSGTPQNTEQRPTRRPIPKGVSAVPGTI